MERIEDQICIFVASLDDASASDIERQFPKISKRNIFRYLRKLRDNGSLKHERIPKKGKRARYSMPDEENTKQDLTMRVFETKGKKHKRIIPNPKITQRNLSSLITNNTQFYKQELKKLKKEPDINYYTFHISVISDCLAWITQLTLAINSGMLGDSTNKLELAKRNKERYEKFLRETLIYNIKTKNEKVGNNIIKATYNIIADETFTEKILSET